LDPGGGEALARELRDGGAAADHVAADLADPGAPGRLVARARERFGTLDILIVAHARSANQSLEQLTAAELDLTYAVNTRAALLLVQALAADRPAGPGGRVVLFTSGQYHEAMGGELPYIASKGALAQVTGSLAVELIARGITVNCVDPGPTDTGYADPPTLAAVARRIPGGRWSEPQDAARLVAWLAGEEAGWVTGQLIASDGGWARRPRGAD
jgi:3-oxoacyl-[acyl-carrier protein] reductase